MPDPPPPSDPEDSAGQTKNENGTPGTSKKTGASAKEKAMSGNQFAKAIGINKPANVRDKIKRWQQEVEPDTVGGASSPPKPESPKPAFALAVKAPTTPKAKPVEDKPDWKPAHTPKKSVDVSPERPTSAKKIPVAHNPLDEDVQTATAPKKRVISDSRWRKQASPPKEADRPAPKVIANAWVRPSKIVKLAGEKPVIPKPKPPPPAAPPLDPILPLINYVGRSVGQLKPPPKPRTLSKPSSSENERPPLSSGSGSGSGKEVKNDVIEDDLPSPKLPKDKAELVKVRRRRRAQMLAWGSLARY